MKISKAIITAMAEEAEKIITHYALKETKNQGYLKIYEAEIYNQDEQENEHIILALCGVGKIHATFATTYLFENYSFEKLVNIGVVGNLRPDMYQVGDVFLPNTFLQHDVYIPESIDSLSYLREALFIPSSVGEDYDFEKFQLHLSGICVTGDQFIDNDELKNELVELYSADIVDMEAYAILSVAKNYDALEKVQVIKSVSDGADSHASTDHVQHLETAMQNALAILIFSL